MFANKSVRLRGEDAAINPVCRLKAWRSSIIDPSTDVATETVLEAFESARGSGLPAVECYRAGVEAWRRSHPDQSAEYAARQAVAVILAAKVSLRVEAD